MPSHPIVPLSLTAALASFDEIYSPRIVATVNEYDVRIAKTVGEHVWHVHVDTTAGRPIDLP